MLSSLWNVKDVSLEEADDLDNDGDEEGEPDDVEDEEEGHEEVEDVVDGEHLNQLQRKLNLDIVFLRQWFLQEYPTVQTANK